MIRIIKISFLAFFCWLQSTTYPMAQINDCKSYKLGEGDSVILHPGSFVDEVVCPKDKSGCRNITFEIKGRNNRPENAIGPPKFPRSYGSVSSGDAYALGCKGFAIWKFTDNVIVDVDGPDIYVFEAGNVKEATSIDISMDGIEWRNVGQVAGGKSNIDISRHVKPGEKFRYIKLTDLGTAKCGPYAGADIKAIATYAFSETKTEDESSGIFFGVALQNAVPMPVPISRQSRPTPSLKPKPKTKVLGYFLVWQNPY